MKKLNRLSKHQILSVFFFFSLQSLPAQEMITTMGTVEHEGQPLPDVTCSHKKDYYFGDIKDKNPFLSEISYTGPDRKILPLSPVLNSQRTIKIGTMIKDIPLEGTPDLAEENTLRNIVEGAFGRLRKNYPDRPHQLEGFYRKIFTKENECTYMEEASILIEDRGYMTDHTLSRLKVNSFRCSILWDEQDSLMAIIEKKTKLKAAMSTNMAVHPLKRSYENYYLRMLGIPSTRFHHNKFRKGRKDTYRFKLMDTIISGNDTIYQIAFTAIPGPSPLPGATYLKINKKDHAILEYRFSQNDGGFVQLVKFQKRSGTYYPQMIRNTYPRGFVDREYETKREVIETIWFGAPEIKNLKKIKRKDAVDRSNLTLQYEKVYDPTFWENYQMPKKYPLSQLLRKDLEKNMTLEQQFMEVHQGNVDHEN